MSSPNRWQCSQVEYPTNRSAVRTHSQTHTSAERSAEFYQTESDRGRETDTRIRRNTARTRFKRVKGATTGNWYGYIYIISEF